MALPPPGPVSESGPKRYRPRPAIQRQVATPERYSVIGPKIQHRERTEMMNIQEMLKNYLLMEIAADLEKESLAPDEDLLEQGIIDSMGIMHLIAFMEENFGIVVDDREIVPENFQTLQSMEQFIGHKTRTI